MARMRDYYVKDVAPALMKKFSYKSVMQIPKLEKIVVNVGCGEARDNPKVIDAIISDLGKITGQKAVPCKAKKSVANFKLREGMTIGAKVTLRGETMYEFLDRLFNIALPRVRDFRGINPNGFDGRGNYNMGLQRAADCSPKSTMIRLIKSAVWTSALSQPPIQTKRLVSCWL